MKLPVPAEQFLAEYWQQKPLFCPQAFPDFKPPLTPDELAGLAMEPNAESRMVWQHAGSWQQQGGPFSEDAFHKPDPWTLLVHGVDHWHSGVSALRQTLQVIPSWRFDDIMVSYATDGAGVGPHFDRYDVFLLQGQGQREWRLGAACDDSTPQLQENGLSLIPPFAAEETFFLEPGDALYIPPGIAHWGIARGESMTFSLGYRAPRIADLLARQIDGALSKLAPQLLLEDGASASTASRPGEITANHIANAKEALQNAIEALDDFTWLGEVVTEVAAPAAQDNAYITAPVIGESVRLNPASRVAWMEKSDALEVFVDGEHRPIPLFGMKWIIPLCQGEWVPRQTLCNDAPPLYEYLDEHNALIDEDSP